MSLLTSQIDFLGLVGHKEFRPSDLSFLEISKMRISCNYAWSQFIRFSWIHTSFPDICHFICYSFKLCWTLPL